MNLNHPKIDELRQLLEKADDTVDSHMLWVARDGAVHLDPLGGSSPLSLSAQHHDMAFRLETFVEGNGYVGTAAAKDDDWVSRLFRALVSHWREGTRGYVDVF
jgi:hypothetical protein